MELIILLLHPEVEPIIDSLRKQVVLIYLCSRVEVEGIQLTVLRRLLIEDLLLQPVEVYSYLQEHRKIDHLLDWVLVINIRICDGRDVVLLLRVLMLS